MRKLISCLAAIICMALLTPVSVSCGGPSEPDNPFVELLALMPATAKEGRVITLIDYRVLREVLVISIYDDDGQRVSYEDYVDIIIDSVQDSIANDSTFGWELLSFGSYWTSGSYDLDRSQLRDEFIGYELPDVDAEIHNLLSLDIPTDTDRSILMKPDVFRANEDLLLAAVGEFDPQATNNALENRDAWSEWMNEIYTGIPYHNIIIHSWGDGTEFHMPDRLGLPHLDRLGRAFSLAVTEGRLFIGSYEEYIKSIIDASLGKTDSLADVPEYALAASGMYELGAIMAVIMDASLIKEYLMHFDMQELLPVEDYLTAAMGPGRDETGEYMALVLVYENTADVEDGVSLIEKKISVFNQFCESYGADSLIYDNKIRTDGRTLLAKLYTTDENLWKYWCFYEWGLAFFDYL